MLCALLIKSLSLYCKVRYGKDFLSKLHEDKLDIMLEDKRSANENAFLIHAAIDDISNSCKLKTAKEAKNAEFPTKELLKSGTILVVLAIVFSVAWGVGSDLWMLVSHYIRLLFQSFF